MDCRRHHEGVSESCEPMRVAAKSGTLSVRQMTGEDGLHQRISGLGAGDHVPDLLVNQLGWNTRIRYRLRDCRISIEHIRAGDLIAVSKRDPAQRGQAGCERECWLLLGVVTGSACQRARIGRARVASSIATSNRPASFAAANHLPSAPGVLATRSRRISSGCLWEYFLAMARNVARFVVP